MSQKQNKTLRNVMTPCLTHLIRNWWLFGDMDDPVSTVDYF